LNRHSMATYMVAHALFTEQKSERVSGSYGPQEQERSVGTVEEAVLWMAISIGIGLTLGVTLGFMIGHLTIGAGAGIAIGIGAGVAVAAWQAFH